jgi:ABC-type glycerol-3-phosphate transport system substrate-binding protein
MKKCIALLLCFLFALNLFGCSVEKNKSENLTYYYSNDSYDTLIDVIERYNKYCNNNLDNSYKIELKEFDSENEMLNIISTEIMAGGGPDIISLNQKLPFEKLIKNKAFLEIDGINFDDCNSTIMSVGQYNGKQYIVPIFYGVNILTSDKESLESYNLPTENGTPVTYENAKNLFADYLSNDEKLPLIEDTHKTLLYKFIMDYVDFENAITEFDSNDFKNALDTMIKLTKSSSGDFNTLFEYSGYNFLSLLSYNNKSKQRIFYNGFNKSDNDVSAYVQLGIAINRNTDNEDKALTFIKYLLSEETQEYFCGVSGSSYVGSNVISYPVNNKTFEYAVEFTKKFAKKEYGTDISKDQYSCNFIENIRKVNKASLYFNPNKSYYCSNVIGDIVDSYLNDDISKEKFIRQLTAATEIYLTE